MLESTDRRSIAEAASEQPDATPKQEWSAPALKTFGDAAALTRAGGMTNPDGVGSQS